MKDSLPFIRPLPKKFTFGNESLSLGPALSLSGNAASSHIVRAAFDRYKGIVFRNTDRYGLIRPDRTLYDVNKLNIIVHSFSEELQLGFDESYSLFQKLRFILLLEKPQLSFWCIAWIRGMYRVWNSIRSILLAYPFRSIVEHGMEKELVVGEMNVLRWHVIDAQSFPLEVPSYPNLWKGSYTKWERYAVEDAYEIVKGTGYPDLWPSPSCREPLDVSKNFTFDVLSVLAIWHKVINIMGFLKTGSCTFHVLLIFPPSTMLGPGGCPKAVAEGFRCIFSNQGVWYLDHLDVPWDVVYTAEPVEGIHKASEQKLVLGGEVCMWAENADISDVLQNIWP
ncbi:hypothetical protein TanjilG_30451 [Lupinus angustifolius]|nr:hypothetical protein TanjilG_30451 [Lupinus angustifolius]